MTGDADGSELVIPLARAEFFTLTSEESPFPGMGGVRKLLRIRFAEDTPEVILAELTIT